MICMRTMPRHGAAKMASLILCKQLLKRGAPQLALGNLFSASAITFIAQLAKHFGRVVARSAAGLSKGRAL